MNGKPESTDPFSPGSGWLKVIEGNAPILLIAPHGGRAGQAARARLHPRINDLHTAEITRELARRLRAHALINVAMDRNLLDCNRVEEVARKAPWMLARMAELVARIAEEHRRVLILVVHGWNVVQPRIDFGLGARFKGGRLQPVSSAHMTASEHFINGPLAELCSRLQANGISPTFGLRYPAAGRQNLLQIFTPRFSQSRLEPLCALARLCAGGSVDALQLELSVALRWPGELRDTTIELLAETFSNDASPRRPSKKPAVIGRAHHNALRAMASPKTVANVPFRFGVELFDPQTDVGLMASMDLHGGGARVIMLFPDGRVALATVEGKLELRRHRMTRGPITLCADGKQISLEFNGPVLAVPDAAAYLRMEQALATGKVERAQVECTLELKDCTGSICFDQQFFANARRIIGFGTGAAAIAFEGERRALHPIGRAGVALLGQPERPFLSRASLWGYFETSAHPRAIEARLEEQADQERLTTGLILADNTAVECGVELLQAGVWTPGSAPQRIDAVLGHPGGAMRVAAQPRCFMALSRPGAAGLRVFTSLGFARFETGNARGAGMFECSASASAPPAELLDLGDAAD
jgi:hypothetical protein